MATTTRFLIGCLIACAATGYDIDTPKDYYAYWNSGEETDSINE